MNRFISIHLAAVMLRARIMQARGMGEPLVVQTYLNPAAGGDRTARMLVGRR